MSPREKRVRAYAYHLALIVRRRGTALVLAERYGTKTIGRFGSWRIVERAIVRYHHDALRAMGVAV